jgi:hypothetical protein
MSTRADSDRDRRVFMNCPYDNDYRPYLDAMILAVVCCGFTPVSAIKIEAADDTRMDRIRHQMCDSRHSIHDLSRYRLGRAKQEPDGADASLGLARFNMPFELGLAVEMKLNPSPRHAEAAHRWIALAPADMPVRTVISDLGAWDPVRYVDEVGLFKATITWLGSRKAQLRLGYHSRLPTDEAAALREFQTTLASVRSAGSKASEAWDATVLAAQRFAAGIPRTRLSKLKP